MNRRFWPLFASLVFLGCDKSGFEPLPPDPSAYEVTAIRLRVFLNFNNFPEPPYFFWVNEENNWTIDTITDRGSRVVLRCENCPPKTFLNPHRNEFYSDGVRIVFEVVGSAQSYAETFWINPGYRRVMRDPDLTVRYLSVSWSCTEWNGVRHENCP